MTTTIKSFDINQWVQGTIGVILLSSVFVLVKMYGDIETAKIEIKQESQLLLEMKAQINVMQGKISEQSNANSLLNQRIEHLQKMVGALLNRIPEMKGMIKDYDDSSNKIRPPIMTDWGAKDISKKVGVSCSGDECDLKPVDPPSPQPETPKPTAK